MYHALNRAVARLPLFQKDGDYEAFERVLVEALAEHPIRLLGWCVMPNHWHFLLWPQRDGQMTAFLRWLTNTHTMRWHAHYHSQGTGHLYQARYKSFPVAEEDNLLTVLRYVERNPLRAGLVRRAEAWRWGSLWHRQAGNSRLAKFLHPVPVPLPKNWLEVVNRSQTEAEVQAVRRALARSCPYGPDAWQERTAQALGLEFTLRPRGRPRKKPE